MKIVIDIPEELISKMDDENYQGVISWFDTTLYCAIKNGTPLPEGHGRLIDADVLKREAVFVDDYTFVKAVWVDDIDSATTIIDADKESD